MFPKRILFFYRASYLRPNIDNTIIILWRTTIKVTSIKSYNQYKCDKTPAVIFGYYISYGIALKGCDSVGEDMIWYYIKIVVFVLCCTVLCFWYFFIHDLTPDRLEKWLQFHHKQCCWLDLVTDKDDTWLTTWLNNVGVSMFFPIKLSSKKATI
jgi:hypothetical protein